MNAGEIICNSLGMQRQELVGYLLLGQKNYTEHKIKTKSKMRTVYEPEVKLRSMQILAVKTVFSALPVSRCSTAYEKGAVLSRTPKGTKNPFTWRALTFRISSKVLNSATFKNCLTKGVTLQTYGCCGQYAR